MLDKTMVFSLGGNRDDEMKAALTAVYEDPTYITTYENARNIISKIDRDDLLEAMLKSYLNI